MVLINSRKPMTKRTIGKEQVISEAQNFGTLKSQTIMFLKQTLDMRKESAKVIIAAKTPKNITFSPKKGTNPSKESVVVEMPVTPATTKAKRAEIKTEANVTKIKTFLNNFLSWPFKIPFISGIAVQPTNEKSITPYGKIKFCVFIKEKFWKSIFGIPKIRITKIIKKNKVLVTISTGATNFMPLKTKRERISAKIRLRTKEEGAGSTPRLEKIILKKSPPKIVKVKSDPVEPTNIEIVMANFPQFPKYFLAYPTKR